MELDQAGPPGESGAGSCRQSGGGLFPVGNFRKDDRRSIVGGKRPDPDYPQDTQLPVLLAEEHA